MAGGGNQFASDLLRTLVLRTNPYFPFRHCNRWPYLAAVGAVTREFRKFPQIRSLYLRHGLTTREWIPGLSDIDLTLILPSGLADGEQFDLVDSLRRPYRRLQRMFPMLGELEILEEDDLPTWLLWTSQAPDRRRWTLLHGDTAIDDMPDCSPNWRARSLNLSLWIYASVLPPCLAKSDSFLRRQDVHRRVRKILRCLQPILRERLHAEPEIDEQTGIDRWIAGAAQALERAIASVDPIPPESPGTPWFSPAADGCRFQPDSVPPLHGLRSVMASGERMIAVVENDLSCAAIAGIADVVLRRWPVLLPQNVLRYFLCRYNPYEYTRCLRDRTILFGADPLDGMPPPGRSEFAAYLLSRTDHLLAFKCGEELFCAPGSLSLVDLRSTLRNMMALQLLLRNGWISPDRAETEIQWRRRFPESAQVIDQIWRDAAGGRERAAQQAAFGLFRSFARVIGSPAGNAQAQG